MNKLVVLGTAFLVACSGAPEERTNAHADTTVPAQAEAESTTDQVEESKMEMNSGEEVHVAETMEGTSEETKPAIQYHSWDKLLTAFVDDKGMVNYKKWKADADAVTRLDAFLTQLNETNPDELQTRADKMCLWMNAYNAYTIKLILEHYPLASIMDVNGGKAWDLKGCKIGGEVYSLNQVENEILRPRFKDARIHFAINCASFSCPTLLNHAFFPKQMEEQLEQVTRAFVNDEERNQLTAGELKISQIFDWYGDDFKDPGVVNFFKKYSEVKLDENPAVSYMEYGWTLNEQK